VAYLRAEHRWSKFRKRRRRQAVPRLVQTVRDEQAPAECKQHAAETLGGVVGKSFHLDADPTRSAEKWLDGRR
jgi:hypothetical protein